MRVGAIGRAALVTTALLGLSACFEREGREKNESAENVVANSGGDEPEPTGEEPRRREADPEMLRQIRSEIDDYRRTLPQRSGPMTITDVDLEGSELIYTQRSNMNLTSEQVDRIEREVTRAVCRGTTGEWIRSGVVMTYRISDPDGDDYTISIDECPEGSAGGDGGGRGTFGGRDNGSSGGGQGHADPALAEELARDVEQFRSQLPQRDGPLTTYDIELQGTEIIYFQRTGVNLDDVSFRRFERGIGAELCRGQGTAQMIRRGGTMTYRITDSEGEVFRTSVSSCP